MVAFEHFVLLIIGICTLRFSSINGENEICGYNGESLICCAGYMKDDQGECIIPICENGCGIGGHCLRPNTCYCSNGRVSPLCSDEDPRDNGVSERRTDNSGTCSNNCNGQGLCVNGQCKCHLGYVGSSCLEKPVGQCYLSLSRGICQKLENSIRTNMEICCSAFSVAWGDPCQKCPKSRCEKGFMEVDGICRDVNECTIPDICRNGQCENFEGTYKCLCTSGLQFDPRKCDCVKTQDMCQRNPSVCGPGMKCVTLPMERYSCQCVQGYTKASDQKSCILKNSNSLDFCAIYGKYVCQYGKCLPAGNNYKCECSAGYKPSGDHKSCKKNIDYCTIYQNMLCQNGICVSINDDYMCKCDPGYTLSFNGKKCTSVCDLYGVSLCPNARCIPQAGGEYECRCNDGYSAVGKGKQCQRIMHDQSGSSSNLVSNNNNNKVVYDIDYCSYDYYKKQCKGGQCSNHKNYYQCECLRGFISEKNGLSCLEIDSPSSDQMLDSAQSTEIKTYCDRYGSFVCANGRCIESGSAYQCQCNNGYKESIDGKMCYDIDECVVNPTICIQGTCTNSPGSYQCSCYDGFTMRYLPGGPKCYDRNECEEDHQLCLNGQCINKWGSFSCSCNAGYVVSIDGKQCLASRSPIGSKDSWHEIECKNCVNSCKQINATYYQCMCPEGLAPVLNTGLCAPMAQVVDIQFDIPTISVTTQKNSLDTIKHLFFELIPGANKSSILAQITSQFRNVVVDKCEPINNAGRDGILCTFYKKSSN